MSQKIQVRRGTDAARQTVTFDLGEPVFTTDTKKFFVGDGVTQGGIYAFSSDTQQAEAFVSITPQSGNTKTQNGTLLRNAILDSHKKRPHNSAKSETNRYDILLYPGYYNITGAPLSIPRYVSINGVGDKKSVVIDVSPTSDGYGIQINSGKVNVENLTLLHGANIGILFGELPPSPATGVMLKDIDYSGVVSFFVSQISNFNSLEIDNVSPILGEENRADDIGLTSSAGTSTNFKNLTIKNLNFYGNPAMFDISFQNTVENLTVNNCIFKSNSVATDIFGATGLINSTISNSEFISGYWFLKNDTYPANTLTINNCTFTNPSTSSLSAPFIFRDCLFKETRGNANAAFVSLSSATSQYPSFYNCNFISNANSSVTGMANSSGLFVNCNFNRVPWSGATGAFGPQGSRFDVRYR